MGEPGGALERPAVIALVLLAAYGLVSMLLDPAGHLSTDVGGKTISVAAMVDGGDWDPDIGYWFEEHDPTGRHHPFSFTSNTSNGTWINSTSLTMLHAARPLWALGGPRLALLIPMLGSVTAALMAGALHRRLDPTSSGALSTWVVGLASPATIYALDFWEHSWGLALMVAGMLGVHDSLDQTRPWSGPIVAGLAYGLAATMRQEALVYGFVAGIVLVSVLAPRREISAAAGRGLAMLAATVVPLAAHTAAEVAQLGGIARLDRGSGTISESGTAPVDRLLSAIATTVIPRASWATVVLVMAVALVSTATVVAVALVRDADVERPALTMGAVWFVFGVLFVFTGPGFVPGLAIAAPAAVFGLVGGLHQSRWLILGLGVAPLPLVLATAFPSGALPQWGGRYLLPTGLVLTVLGLSWLSSRSRSITVLVVACAVGVTGVGVWNTVERTNAIGEVAATIEERTSPDDIVVWHNSSRARELGELALERKWLSAGPRDDQAALAELLAQHDVERLVWISHTSIDGHLDGYRPTVVLADLEVFEATMVKFVRDR